MENAFKELKKPEKLVWLLITLFSIAFYMLMNHLSYVSEVIGRIISILSPFLAAIVISYLLYPVCMFFENKLLKKMRNRKEAHALAVICTFIAALLVLSFLLVAILPQLISSLSLLVNNSQSYYDSFIKWFSSIEEKLGTIEIDIEQFVGSWSEVGTKISSWLLKSLGNLLGTTYALGNKMVSFALALVISIYMLLDSQALIKAVKKMFTALMSEHAYGRLSEIAKRSDKIFMAFIGGNLVDSLIVGVLNFIFMVLLGMPYSLLISVIVAVTNLIPTFGPVIGAIPSVLILIMLKPIDALWFLIFTIVLQTCDANIIKPMLLGNGTGVKPVWVLVSIIIGGRMFGITGMVLAIPVFAIASSIIEEAIEARIKQKEAL